MSGGRPSKYAIYALRDPRTDEIRYIGQTANPDDRLAHHCRLSFRDQTPRANWIRKLQAEGLKPILAVIEWTEDWETSEQAAIAKHREDGNRLLNVARGGRDMAHARERRRGKTPSGFLIRKLSNIASDLNRSGERERASEFRALVAGLRLTKERIFKSNGELGIAAYDAEIGHNLGERWTEAV